MAKEYMNGMRLASGDKFLFKIEGIGLANDQKSTIDAIQKLVNQEEVALTTGLLGHKGLTEIIDFVSSIDHPLIYSDFGAKKPIDLTNKENVFCNSLDLFKGTVNVTAHLTKQGYNNIGVSSSYYDVGYDFGIAMDAILSTHSEANLSGMFITPHQPRENEAELMKEYFSSIKTDAIIGIHSDVFAEEHADFVAQNNIHKEAPFFLSPFSVEQNVLKKHPLLFDGCFTYSSWYPELETKENQEFVASYIEKYGKQPSFFSLLGYENNLLIEQHFNKNKKEIEGPRGSLNSVSKTNRTNYPQYVWELKTNENEIQRKKKFDLADADYDISGVSVETGGWDNAYLCR